MEKDIPMLASSVTDNGEAVPDGGIRTLMEEVLTGDSLLLLDMMKLMIKLLLYYLLGRQPQILFEPSIFSENDPLPHVKKEKFWAERR